MAAYQNLHSTPVVQTLNFKVWDPLENVPFQEKQVSGISEKVGPPNNIRLSLVILGLIGLGLIFLDHFIDLPADNLTHKKIIFVGVVLWVTSLVLWKRAHLDDSTAK